MAIELKTTFIKFETKGRNQILDITQKVEDVIRASGFVEGNVTLFGVGSTTGLSTIEFEPGLVQGDIPDLFEKLAPYNANYEHHNTWGCDNGASHVRSTLMGSSLVVPFIDQKLTLGTWQQIIFIDFDTRPRSRKVVVQLTGVKQ